MVKLGKTTVPEACDELSQAAAAVSPSAMARAMAPSSSSTWIGLAVCPEKPAAT